MIADRERMQSLSSMNLSNCTFRKKHIDTAGATLLIFVIFDVSYSYNSKFFYVAVILHENLY